MSRVLEHVVVPKDRVFDELLVSKSPDCAAVLVRGEFKHVSFNLHVDVMVEKTLTTQVSLDQHFQSAHQVLVSHVRHVHREH